jgi:probable F420-dependent oxidoreductase
MRVDLTTTPRQPYEDLTEICEVADALGFSALWCPENAHDAFLPLAIAATKTQNVELGTKVAVAFARSPMNLAYMSWDLQAISNGRFILGLGSQVKGHIQRRFNLPWGSPAPRMKETVLALRAIWECWQNKTPLNFQGRFHSFTLMPDMYNPGPIEHPHIPIHLSAINKYMCRTIGEVADGILIHPFHTPRHLKEVIIPEIRIGADRAERDINDIAMVLSLLIGTGNTPNAIRQARAEVRQSISFYGSTRSYTPFMEFHGWGELVPRLHELSIEGKWGEMANLIPDEMVDSISIVCPPDEIVPRMKERYGGLAHRISLDTDFFWGLDHHFREELVEGLTAIA